MPFPVVKMVFDNIRFHMTGPKHIHFKTGMVQPVGVILSLEAKSAHRPESTRQEIACIKQHTGHSRIYIHRDTR